VVSDENNPVTKAMTLRKRKKSTSLWDLGRMGGRRATRLSASSRFLRTDINYDVMVHAKVPQRTRPLV